MQKVNIAMIGVGNISGIYLENIHNVFRELRLAGVYDLVRSRAEDAQRQWNIPKVYDTMHDAFADPEVDIVLNLTRPYEHFEVSRAALQAGKHVYSEKPLGATLDEGVQLRDLALEKNLMLGGAPDTFLGAGIQTCRRLIDDGHIGAPVGSAAHMICRGHESWHPDPAFYYQYGGGPMLDMGPYYLTAMINLLGGIDQVVSAGKRSFPQRVVTSEPLAGTVVDVDVSTYVAGTVRYASGAIGTLFTTFDVHYPAQAKLEIYGSEGTLEVPDPNTFGGPVRLYRQGQPDFMEIPLLYAYEQNSRALGLADMAKALVEGRPARADAQQTFHVLEAMEGFETSAREGRWVALQSRYERRPAMTNPVLKGILD